MGSMGGTSDGEGAITLLAYAFTGSLCQAFCLTSQRLTLSVAMFHYYDRSDLSAGGQGPKPSVNVASHLIFCNVVAFLEFAF